MIFKILHSVHDSFCSSLLFIPLEMSLAGGLNIRVSHCINFQKPKKDSNEERPSLLGLDKLAQEKKAGTPKFPIPPGTPEFKHPDHKAIVSSLLILKESRNYRQNYMREQTPVVAGSTPRIEKRSRNDFERDKKKGKSDWESNTPAGRPSSSRHGSETPGSHRYQAPTSSLKSEWEYYTPRVSASSYQEYPFIADVKSSEIDVTNEISSLTQSDYDKWSSEQKQVDRNWYDVSEDGAVDLEHNSFTEMEEFVKEKGEEIKKRAGKKMSLRQAHCNKETEMWEANRMLTSGVVQRTAIDNNIDDENEESKVHLMVHDLKPPFLDGKNVFSKQLDTIQHVRDPTSDMAVFARKGSQLVQEMREKKEISKAMKTLDGAGTTLGNVMGKQSHKAELIDKVTQKLQESEEDFKKDSKFSSHLKPGEAASAFSRNKSIREQREFLPAFSVRNDLMRVIRENQSNPCY